MVVSHPDDGGPTGNSDRQALTRSLYRADLKTSALEELASVGRFAGRGGSSLSCRLTTIRSSSTVNRVNKGRPSALSLESISHRAEVEGIRHP